VSLIELHEAARPPAHWRDIEAGYADPDLLEYTDQYDVGLDDDGPVVEVDEQDRRFNMLVRKDEGRRTPRRSWFQLRQVYAANPGVELRKITEERVQRHKADQAAIQKRLRNSPRQPQDRHNAVTKDVVASRATESRRLNHHYASADPRPAWQREEFSFQAESVDGGPYRAGRPAGQRSATADYRWNMQDGFIL
jgi:hypothetical protein